MILRDPKRHDRSKRFGLSLESRQKLLRFVEPSLQDADPGETRSGMDAARTLSGVGKLTNRRDELLFGRVDTTIRGKDVGTAGSAEGEQRDGVVLANEALEHGTPLLRPLGIVRELAREHQRAADVGERLQACGFACCGRSHRFVKTREALFDVAARDFCEPELCERAQLEVDVSRRLRHVERAAGESSRLLRVSCTLRAREREPALLGAGRNVVQETLRSSEPALSRSLVAEGKRVLAREPKRNACGARKLAVTTEARVGPLPVNNGAARIPEPPQCAGKTVESLRGVGRLDGGRE
jgi:hypothetical protein